MVFVFVVVFCRAVGGSAGFGPVLVVVVLVIGAATRGVPLLFFGCGGDIVVGWWAFSFGIVF